ncbi:hypothetical protein [Actinomadura alba]|uniref:Uncharacterized protein n=1 Tax=Actinomadura alba TaxID=406431 RepID=A0ABR7M0N5_9ACTN|nr:hypothetical protein [Actinomadura alba]MBC6470586.1 hypothetical protein [Actinomadura alba]
MRPEIVIGILSVIATISAALIQRSWNWRSRRFPRSREALTFGAIQESGSFSLDEVAKVLDLRNSPGSPGQAVLNDTYLVRRQSEKGNGLVSIYSTSGELEGDCLSHPHNHTWGPYGSAHMRVNRAMAVDLSHLADQSVTRVVHQVVFTGAYDNTPTENFETHIERPTRALVFILLFSADRPCTSVTGHLQVGRRQRTPTDRERGPVLLRQGTIAYWRIVPNKGEWLPEEANYRIEWNWRSRRLGSEDDTGESAADGVQGAQ